MRQIDIMVNNKRLEWEASIKSTEAQLRQREEEMTTMKMALDLKTAEVGILNLISLFFWRASVAQGPKLCKFHVISWNFVIFMLDFFMFMSCFVNFMLFHEHLIFCIYPGLYKAFWKVGCEKKNNSKLALMLLHSYQAKKKEKRKRGPRFQKGDVVPWLTSKKKGSKRSLIPKGGGGGAIVPITPPQGDCIKSNSNSSEHQCPWPLLLWSWQNFHIILGLYL